MKATDASVDESLYVNESVASNAAVMGNQKPTIQATTSADNTPPVSPEAGNGDDEDFDDNASKKFEPIPWYQNKRYGLAAALICCAAFLGGAALAFLLGWVDDDSSDGGNSASSSSSNAGGFNDGNGNANPFPSASPTLFPSFAPSTSKPSTTPSSNPTPLASSSPSDVPTAQPSHAPTMVPSSSPTEHPSSSPTLAPIVGTRSPSSTPSISPSEPDVLFEKFSFYVMGDTPYGQAEGRLLYEQIDEMRDNYEAALATFSVHVGDFQLPDRSQCAESFYEQFYTYLLSGPLPTFVLAGDNDWVECPSQQDGINKFLRYFTGFTQADGGGFETEWKTENPLPFPVTRDYANNRPELFYFEYQNILFFSINILQVSHDRDDRNTDWVKEHMERAFTELEATNDSSRIRAVMIFGHGNRSPNNRPFFEDTAYNTFFTEPYRRDIPVVYMHGDGHRWRIDRRLSEQIGWTNQWDITVDRGGKAPPVLVEIAPVINGALVPFVQENEFQLLIGDGLIRLDRQGGRYPE